MAPKLVTLTKFPDIVGNWWELGEELQSRRPPAHSDARRAALKKRLIEIEKQLQASYKAQSEEEERKQ